MSTVPTSIDACIELEISFGEIDCALLVTALGTNNKTHRTTAKARPSVPKSNSARCLAASISVARSLASSELGCPSDQRPSADNASPKTHAIAMATNPSARKTQNIALHRRQSRGYPKLLSTSIRSASQPAEARPKRKSTLGNEYRRDRWLGPSCITAVRNRCCYRNMTLNCRPQSRFVYDMTLSGLILARCCVAASLEPNRAHQPRGETLRP